MENEQYTCTICLDRFVQPRSTKCGHIFCCLFSFVFETRKNSVGRYFECPVCRGEIDLPHSEVTLQWVMETFPLDLNIIHNMETKTESRMEDKQKLSDVVDEGRVICAPCKEKGRECTAIKYCFNRSEALCKVCSEWHNNFKLLKQHDVMTLDRNRLLYDKALSDIHEKYAKCKKHLTQSCVSFCQTHKTFCCLPCVTSEHRLCELLNISENGERSREKALVVAEMHKNAIKHIESLLKLKRDNSRSFLSNIEEMSSGIGMLKKELFDRLERQFSNVMSQLKEIQIRMQSDNELEKKLNELKEQCEQKTEILETLLRCNMNEHVFIVSQSLQLELAELEKELVKIDAFVEGNLVCLDVSNELRHFEEKLKSNDTVIRVKLQTVPLEHELYKPIEDLVNDFKVQILTPLDVGMFQTLPLFTCIDVCNDNLLLYDRGFSNVYSYNTVVKTGSNFRLDHVCGLLHFDKETILVSKPELFTISLLKLKAGKPSSCITWKLQVRPFTLCRLGNDAFVVATQEPTGFKFFKIRGTQLIPETHLTSDTTGSEIYPAEYYTADTNKSRLILSCQEQREINCLTFEGQQIFRFQNPLLECPQGVTVDKNGNIYVCNHSYFKPSVLVLSASGTLLFEIKEGIPRKPISICSDKAEKRFWLTSNYAESSSSVYIFELVKIVQD